MTDALIGAFGTVAAAFIGVLTWYLASRSDRRRETAERETQRLAEQSARDQRVLDLVAALHSEILAGIMTNRRQLTPEEAHYAITQSNPFATADETDFVFDSVKHDISILPAEVIHSVVQYYRTAAQSNLMTRDLRDPLFLAQKTSEKQKFVTVLLQIVELQKILGEAALADLTAFAIKSGIDLAENEKRASRLVDEARADIAKVFKRSGGSGPSSLSPVKRGQPVRGTPNVISAKNI